MRGNVLEQVERSIKAKGKKEGIKNLVLVLGFGIWEMGGRRGKWRLFRRGGGRKHVRELLGVHW